VVEKEKELTVALGKEAKARAETVRLEGQKALEDLRQYTREHPIQIEFQYINPGLPREYVGGTTPIQTLGGGAGMQGPSEITAGSVNINTPKAETTATSASVSANAAYTIGTHTWDPSTGTWSGLKALQMGTEYVPETRPYLLHRGEKVIPASEAGKASPQVVYQNTVNINNPLVRNDEDLQRIEDHLKWALKTRF
jgi:hypothetical protein